MPRLWRLAIRNFWSRTGRSITTILAVACSAALVAGTTAGFRTAETAVCAMLDQWLGRADVSLASAIGEAMDDQVLAEARRTPGVAAVGPQYQVEMLGTIEPAASQTQGASPSSAPWRRYMVCGVEPAAEAHLRGHGLLRGRFLRSDGAREIVLAARADLLGARVRLVGLAGREAAFVVVGQVPPRPSYLLPDAFIRLDDFRALCPAGGQLLRVNLKLASGADLDQVVQDLRGRLGIHVDVKPGPARHPTVRAGLGALAMTFQVTSALALLVAGFIVWTTMGARVAERLGQLGLLRALGAMRWQLFGLTLAEGMAFGAAGAALGVPLGLAAGWAVLRSIAPARVAFVVGPDAVLWAVGGALAITLLATAWPAVRASRVWPLEALRPQSRSQPGRLQRWGWLAGLAAWGAAVPLVYGSYDPLLKLKLCGYVGVPLLLVGAALVATRLVTILVWLAHWPLRLVVPGPARLALWALRADRLRAAGLAIALMVAAALVVHTRATVHTLVRQWDARLTAGPDAALVSWWRPFPPEVLQRLLGSRRVRLATPLRVSRVHPRRLFGDRPALTEPQVVFIGVEKESLVRLLQSPIARTQQSGTPAARYLYDLEPLTGGNGVLISAQMARAGGLKIGDEFVLDNGRGGAVVEVVGLATSLVHELPLDTIGLLRRALLAPGLIVEMVGSADWAERELGLSGRNVVLVQLISPQEYGPYVKEIQPVLEEWNRQWGGGVVFEFASFKQGLFAWVDRALAHYTAFNMVVLSIAGLGVAASMLGSVTARRRQIGLLRALGMTRGQVRRMILVESALVGLAGGLLAVGLGLGTAQGGLLAVQGLFGFEAGLEVPLRPVLLVIGATTVLAGLAGLGAAAQAAATRVLGALAPE